MNVVQIAPPFEELFAEMPTSVGLWCRETGSRLGSQVIFSSGEVGNTDGFHALCSNSSSEDIVQYGQHAANLCSELNPDIVHIHTLPEVAAAVRKVLPEVRIVLHLHSEWLGDRDFGPVDALIGCSRYIEAKHKRFEGPRSTLNYGVDAETFIPGESNTTNGPRLLYVGRLSPERGLHDLMEAFGDIVIDHPEASLDLVGPLSSVPSEYEACASVRKRNQDLLTTHGGCYETWLRGRLAPRSAGRVKFWGERPHADLPEIYRNADIFVFPSAWDEPYGLPVLEAMACGLPVVAVNTGGLRDFVINQRTGFMVAPYAHVLLSESISKLAADPTMARTFGLAGRERAASKFTWDKIADELEAFYRMLSSF
jgi:glycosyltransferase involved in cell wall biosynthesis